MDNRTLPRHNHVRRSDVNCCLCYQFVLDHVFKKEKKQTQRCPGCHVPEQATNSVQWARCAKAQTCNPTSNMYIWHTHQLKRMMTHELLQAIRSLSSQVGTRQLEHQKLLKDDLRLLNTAQIKQPPEAVPRGKDVHVKPSSAQESSGQRIKIKPSSGR